MPDKRAGDELAKPSKPTVRPECPNFGSGPCKKRPGWSVDALAGAPLGRSHRSALGKGKLEQAINETKELLRVPDGYEVGIVPASDTGAVEMAMWALLGPRAVDVCHWESFGSEWYTDAINQLKLDNVRNFGVSDYGECPRLSETDPKHDIIFTFNGTTSGVRVPNLDWISDDREGLTICDATSAIFAMDMSPWSKLDVVTYSWQKVLGGEGAHGVLILGPRAIERLESYVPDRPLPKIFRLTKGSPPKLARDIFRGATINTPSMMCVEDYLDALAWARGLGGLDALIEKSNANFNVMAEFVSKHDWINFLAKDPATRSNTSVCLTLSLDAAQVKQLTTLLEKEEVAFDIGAYRTAPAGLRIWCGATIEASDVQALTKWLEWAYNVVKQS